MTTSAIYPGSFDPVTLGHEDLIQRSLHLVDKVIVAVAVNAGKDPLFTLEERVELLTAVMNGEPRVEVVTFDGLLADFAKGRGVRVVIRGLRAVSDFEYESQMALANKTLDPEVEIVYMMTEGKYAHLSSSIIKEIITFGGSGHGMIHPVVEKRLREKLKRP